ncbi:MAG: alpha/beta hydrolase, partial [bacterium]|nr:alpha/beta hydrolase [bacterium]
MKEAARILSYLSAFLSLLTMIRSPTGIMGGVMWLPKLWVGAWAPFLAIVGGLGVLFGLVYRDWMAVWAGLLGMALAVRHIARVVAQHDNFAQAFGPDWEARIRLDLRARMPRNRYRLVQAKPPIVPGQRDVILGTRAEEGELLLCDIWEPSNDAPRTGLAVIYLHGSLWEALDKDFLTQPLFRRLAGQGHVIMDVAYSLTPEANLYDMMGDVKQAIAWMKTHSAEYGVDPSRIVLMGQSGGGHLALLAAYTPNHPAFQPEGMEADTSVRAAVSLYGVTDLVAFFHEYCRANPKQPEYSSQITDDLRPRVYDTTALDRFLTRTRVFPPYRHGNMPGGPLLLIYLLGGTLNETPETYRLGSPITHVGPQCPPTLQLFGDDDFAVDASHGRRLHETLCQAGVTSAYVEFPDTVHGF